MSSYLRSLPIADEENPCFVGAAHGGEVYISSFTQLLERAVDEEGEDYGIELLQTRRGGMALSGSSTLDSGSYSFAGPGRAATKKPPHDLVDAFRTSYTFKPHAYTPLEASSTTRSSLHLPSTDELSRAYSLSELDLSQEYDNSSNSSCSSTTDPSIRQFGRRTLVDSVRKNTTQHKRKHSSLSTSTDSSTNLHGPAKRSKSILDANDASFEIAGPVGRIRSFLTRPRGQSSSSIHLPQLLSQKAMQDRQTIQELSGRVRALEDELYGVQVGTESPRGLGTFVARLDAALPGIGLKRKLAGLSHQSIANVLGADGHLHARILNLLRTSEIWALNLGPSLQDMGGLNLGATTALQAFSKPQSFLFLEELDFTGAHLRDIELTHVHHLPRLSAIILTDTDVGDEAVFHLVRARRTLEYVDLAGNARVSDDCIPALVLLRRLRYVSLLDTGVRMPGLRRFAGATDAQGREVDVDVPAQCEVYLKRLGTQYVIEPEAPLIKDPGTCEALTAAALARNLAAHAAYDPAIVVGGTREEMRERLERLLVRRREDLKVRAMVWRRSGRESRSGSVESEE